MPTLSIQHDEEAVAAAAAERVTSLIEQAVRTRGNALVCLTGGGTPKRLYELLADERRLWRSRVDWTSVHLFWGDERHVPPDHADSNFQMASRAFLSQVPVPPGQVHRMRGECHDPVDAARDYEMTLRTGFRAAGRTDFVFDVMLLGLGTDAHIASLFPGSTLLSLASQSSAPTPRVAAVWADHLKAWRVTLTPPAILEARTLVMLVAGGDKAAAVEAALECPLDVNRWPVQLLRAAGTRVEWIIDAAAAVRLRAGRPS